MFTQASLFEEDITHSELISGLTTFADYISPEQEVALLTQIDQQPWLPDLKRRVQHYGYKYDYTARRVNASMKVGEIPDWLAEYAEKLHAEGLFPDFPDQVIINEYLPGQGIAPHIDCVPCFEETIASLSLGSSYVMDFTHAETAEKNSVLLEPRSLIVLSKQARYEWKHGIAARKTDRYQGQVISRGRRISLTFRKVVLD